MSGYQLYPSSDKPVEPDRGEAPSSVRNAIKLMYGGAAVSVIVLVISVVAPLVDMAGTKATIKKDHPKFTAAQVSQSFNQLIVVAVLSGVIITALWLWMARANGLGRNWARITSSVLFALATVQLFGALNTPSLLGVVFAALTWAIGLATIILLWRRESSEFFKPRQFS